ncbi:olfactory receptor 10G4-like [Lepisosteus oculatus]|uniref:olfactory receptor 10G4-like n=1 Tax=Lepisosteus oculatus TaxID=7918 RepID=UPI003720AF45
MPFSNVTPEIFTEFIITGFNGVEHPRTIGFVILAIYAFILLGSSINIYIISRDKHLHTPMYFFICNLAVVDILYSTSVSPVMMVILIADMKTISYKPCLTQMFMFHFGGVMEIFAITLMAYDRLIAISYPLRYHSILTRTRILGLAVATWALGSALTAIFTGTADRLPYCLPALKYAFCDYAALVRAACVNPDEYFVLSTVISFFALFGTFTFIALSYLKIIFAVVKISSPSARKKMFSTCLTHLIVVACVFAPPFVSIILTRLGLVLSLKERHILLIGSCLGPSLLNPFVYCLRTKEIRSQLLRIFKTVEPTIEPIK